MDSFRRSFHTVSNLRCHIVWETKYRYHVLKGDLKTRCRDLLVQVCDSEDVLCTLEDKFIVPCPKFGTNGRVSFLWLPQANSCSEEKPLCDLLFQLTANNHITIFP